MTTNNPNSHAEFAELIPAYVTGGLDAQERAAFEAHLTLCPQCVVALRDAEAMDLRVKRLFNGARPAAGLEDRVIQRLRLERPRRRWALRLTGGSWRGLKQVHPAVLKVTSGLAAALVLGAVGLVGNNLMEGRPATSLALLQEQPQMTPGMVAEDDYRRMHEVRDLDDSLEGLKGIAERNGRWGVVEGKTGRRGADYDRSGGWDYKAGGKPAGGSPDAPSRELFQRRVSGASGPVSGGDDYDHAEADREKGAARGLKVTGVVDRAKEDRFAKDPSGAGRLEDGAQTEYAHRKSGEGLGDAGVLEAQASFDPLVFKSSLLYDQTLNGPVGGEQVEKTNHSSRANEPALSVTENGKLGKAGASSLTVPSLTTGAGTLVTSGTVVLKNKSALDLADKSYFRASELEKSLSVETEGRTGVSHDRIRMTEHKVDGKEAQTKQGGGVLPVVVARDGDKDGDGVQDSVHPTQTLARAVGDANEGGPAPAVTPPGAAPTAPPTAPPQAVQMRKIIRNGEIEFEVDSFDSSYVTVSRIVTEEGGFVSSTNSEKLNNGKVRGTIIVRVGPDRLDTLVMKLRALGELKGQKINAQDITKAYYDIESELRANRAMEERVLSIIKSGKGEIKDLLEAEKQLGVYREKIEKLEGEIRYYNNLVSLSTLSITCSEKDIKAPTFAAQTEDVSMGLETEDVEKARGDALKAIDDAKGRVIESNLKKFDAGQLAATIVAEVSPDAAGALTDRLKQIGGRVARLDIDRKQTTQGGQGAPMPGMRVERKDTRFAISIYNLANIAPRHTTSVALAVPGVEEAYRAILEAVKARGGRVVTSSLNRQKPETTTATIAFEVPAAEADATLLELRRDREVLSLSVSENPDTNNVTSAKRGFTLQVASLATVAPRQTESAVLVAKGKVQDAYKAILDELRKADARVLVSQLNEQDRTNVSGQLDFEVLRTKEADVRAAIALASETFSSAVSRSSDAENTVDSKVRLSLRLMSLDRIQPRETQTFSVASPDVRQAYQKLLAFAQESGIRVITSNLNEQDPLNINASVDFEILRGGRDKADKALAEAGVAFAKNVQRAPEAQAAADSKLRLVVTLVDQTQVAPRKRSAVTMEVQNVDERRSEVIAAVSGAGGRVVRPVSRTDASGVSTWSAILDLPASAGDAVRSQIARMGVDRGSSDGEDYQAPGGAIARASIELTLAQPNPLVEKDSGLVASLKAGLSTSLRGLFTSLKFIIVGVCLVGPWLALVWIGTKIVRRNKKGATAGGSAV